MTRSSNIWLTAHGSYASDSLGTKHHTGKPAFSHACMQLLLLLFPWFTKPYEVYTSVMGNADTTPCTPASQWLREVRSLVPGPMDPYVRGTASHLKYNLQYVPLQVHEPYPKQTSVHLTQTYHHTLYSSSVQSLMHRPLVGERVRLLRYACRLLRHPTPGPHCVMGSTLVPVIYYTCAV